MIRFLWGEGDRSCDGFYAKHWSASVLSSALKPATRQQKWNDFIWCLLRSRWVYQLFEKFKVRGWNGSCFKAFVKCISAPGLQRNCESRDSCGGRQGLGDMKNLPRLQCRCCEAGLVRMSCVLRRHLNLFSMWSKAYTKVCRLWLQEPIQMWGHACFDVFGATFGKFRDSILHVCWVCCMLALLTTPCGQKEWSFWSTCFKLCSTMCSRLCFQKK